MWRTGSLFYYSIVRIHNTLNRCTRAKRTGVLPGKAIVCSKILTGILNIEGGRCQRWGKLVLIKICEGGGGQIPAQCGLLDIAFKFEFDPSETPNTRVVLHRYDRPLCKILCSTNCWLLDLPLHIDGRELTWLSEVRSGENTGRLLVRHERTRGIFSITVQIQYVVDLTSKTADVILGILNEFSLEIANQPRRFIPILYASIARLRYAGQLR